MADQSELDFQAAYRLSHAIGAGGAGEVWLATQVSLGRLVVVKFIRPQMMADELSLKRFEREAKVLSRLSHPHIVPVYEYGQRGGQPYLVMEYVAGGSLTARLDAGTVDDLIALRWATQIADGLSCLHREGIVHRDIKPGNILLSETGVAKLADFGLARHEGDRTVTSQGPLLGTPHYVAPEVLLCADPSAKSDLYALGVVLYQLLARRLPWTDSADISQLIAQRVNSPPHPLERYRDDLPRTLTSLVNRLLIPDPDRRPGDAAEVRQQVEELTEQSFGKLRGPSHVSNLSTPRQASSDDIQSTGVLSNATVDLKLDAPPVSAPVQRDAVRMTGPRRAPTVPPAGGSTRWKLGVALGLLTGVCVWLAGTRINDPFRVEHFAARPAGRGMEVEYRTNRSCSTTLRIAVPGERVLRIVAPGETGAQVHKAVVTDLPESASLEVSVVFPDGSSAPFKAQTQTLQAQPLVVERLPRRARVRLTTAVKARLEAEAVPVGLPTLAEERAGTQRATSAAGLTHHLDVGPLEPRQVYELRTRIVLSGEERPLKTITLASPLVQLAELARDVRAAGLVQALDEVDRKRTSTKDAPNLAPVHRALDRVRWVARRDELARVGPESRLDEELTPDEKRAIYQGLQDLRVLDRFAEAHGLRQPSGVERVMPPDLVWGHQPLFAAGAPATWTPFPKDASLIAASEEHVNLWTEGPKLSDSVTVTLAVPPLEGAKRVQLSLRVSRNRASAYVFECESFPVPLMVVPPTETVFLPATTTMYHAVPVSWLKPGPMAITMRLVMLPGFFRNPRSEGTVKYSDLRSNCPVPEELALHITGAR